MTFLSMNEWTNQITFVYIQRSVNGISNKRWRKPTAWTFAVGDYSIWTNVSSNMYTLYTKLKLTLLYSFVLYPSLSNSLSIVL